MKDNNKQKKEEMNPLFRFFVMIVIVVGIVFIFYGAAQSNFGYPPLEDIPRHPYQAEQTGPESSPAAPGVNLEKLEQPWPLSRDIAQPGVFTGQLERMILAKTNEERARRNLPALEGEDGLARTARYHSGDMGKNNFFDHQNLDNVGPSFRAAKIHRRYIGLVGENIYHITTSAATAPPDPAGVAEKIMRGWMNSTGHRRNILDKTYNVLGVGCCNIEKNNQTHIYATQVFGKKMGRLEEDLPQQTTPRQELSIKVRISDPGHLASTGGAIINVENRSDEGKFSLNASASNNRESTGTIKTPAREGIYQLILHVPYLHDKNTYAICRGPLFIVKEM